MTVQIAGFPAARAQDDLDVCPPGFTGLLTPRLAVGERARVLPGITLNVRPQPTTEIARIGVLPPLTGLTVLDGPRCSEGFVWWQTEFAGRAGWVAEGGGADETYWLEARGELILLPDHNGVMRRFVRGADGVLEREGCLRPPDDYAIIEMGFARLNQRTLFMLDNARRIYESYGGRAVNFRQAITQGSYNPGGVDASFGTHDGGGALDLSVRSYLDFSVLADEIEPMIDALRVAGFAAWLRATGELYADSPIHIHAIAIGDRAASEIARQQVSGGFGYLRGFNGIPPQDGALPFPDRHGPPLICRWMVADGFVDMRPSVVSSSP